MGLCECTERNFTFTSESEDDLRTIMVHRYLRNVKDKKLNKLKEIQEEESIVEEVKPKRAPKPKKRKSKLR